MKSAEGGGELAGEKDRGREAQDDTSGFLMPLLSQT